MNVVTCGIATIRLFSGSYHQSTTIVSIVVSGYGIIFLIFIYFAKQLYTVNKWTTDEYTCFFYLALVIVEAFASYITIFQSLSHFEEWGDAVFDIAQLNLLLCNRAGMLEAITVIPGRINQIEALMAKVIAACPFFLLLA